MIPYGQHSIDDADVEVVVIALRNDLLSTGPLVEEFEAELEKIMESRRLRQSLYIMKNVKKVRSLLMRTYELLDRVVGVPQSFSMNCWVSISQQVM